MDARAPADCGTKESLYRPIEKTLFVGASEERFALVVAIDVAGAVCLHTKPRIAACDPSQGGIGLLDDFYRRLAETAPKGKNGAEKPREPKKKRDKKRRGSK